MTADTLNLRQLAPTKQKNGDSQRQRVGDRVSIFKSPRSPNWYLDYSIDNHQFRRSLGTKSKKRALDLAKKRMPSWCWALRTRPRVNRHRSRT
jgi:hypothetical protein